MGKKILVSLCAVLLTQSVAAFAAIFHPTLIGGRYVTEGEFPEVLYISSGGARCSASLIGEKTLLTAAHCTKDNGQVVPVSENELGSMFVSNQVIYKATCTISDKYKSDDHDMALCLIDQAPEIKPASVVAQGAGPKFGDMVTHVGYGCVNPRKPDGSGGNGGNDGRLKIGEARVTKASSALLFPFYVTFGDGLCFGDSGGPSYVKMLDAKTEKHVVTGVNSQGNIRDTNYLTDLSTEQSYKFMHAWIAKTGATICGVNKDCNPKPTPEPENPSECRREKRRVASAEAKLAKYEVKLKKCLDVSRSSDEAMELLPFFEENE